MLIKGVVVVNVVPAFASSSNRRRTGRNAAGREVHYSY